MDYSTHHIACLSQADSGQFCQVRGLKVIIFVFKVWQGLSSFPGVFFFFFFLTNIFISKYIEQEDYI